MSRSKAVTDAAAVFHEARILVAEVRQSRQRSPARRFPDGDSSLLAGARIALTSDADNVEFHTKSQQLGVSHPCDTILSLGQLWAAPSQSAAIAVNKNNGDIFSSNFQYLSHSPTQCGDIGVRSSQAPGSNSGATNWGSRTQHENPQPLDNYLTQHAVGASGMSGITTETEIGTDTGTAGDDQPSRWQQLKRRVNDELAAATGLSPPKPACSPDTAKWVPSTANPSGDGSAIMYGNVGAAATAVHATSAAGVKPYSKDQCDSAKIRRSQTHSPGGAALSAYAGKDDAATKRWTKGVVMAPLANGGAAGIRRSGAGSRQLAGPSGTFASPYERAVAALQQAELQLREHKQRGGGDGGGTPPTSPASAALAAAERFLAGGAPSGPTAVPRAAATMYGKMDVRNMARYGSEREGASEGSFEDIARGLVTRLASSVRLGLGVPGETAVPSGALGHSFAVLEPPPAQHVAAAAALAAATAAAGSGETKAAATSVAVAAGSSKGGCAPELELQIAMQGLMAAARQASSEDALRGEQERRRREAEAAAEAAMAAVEERAAQLARVVLYLRLWGVAARWSRREALAAAAELRAARTRRHFAAWRAAARVARTERLAAEAVELAEKARREQVACRFRRLWLLHQGLVAWRHAAVAGAEERRRQAVAAAEFNREQQAEARREATADRFRRLWLMHTHMRIWRTAARAQATARKVSGRAAVAATATAAAGTVSSRPAAAVAAAAAAVGAADLQQRRSAAVAALLDRLRRQREEFRTPTAGAVTAGADAAVAAGCDYGRQPGGGVTGASCSAAGAVAGSAGAGGGGRSRPSSAGSKPAAAGPAAAGPAAAAAAGRSFPGLNKWIRPEVMRGRSGGGGGRGGGASAVDGPGGASVPRCTQPVPFQLSTSARARYRRNQVLAACEGTRHLVSAGVEAGRVTDPWDTAGGGDGAAPPSAAWAAAPQAGVSAGALTHGSAGPWDETGQSASGAGGAAGDSALQALRQMVRRRHHQRRSGSAGGAPIADPRDGEVRPTQEEVRWGHWRDGATDERDGGGLEPALSRLALSSASSVWSSREPDSEPEVPQEEEYDEQRYVDMWQEQQEPPPQQQGQLRQQGMRSLRHGRAGDRSVEAAEPGGGGSGEGLPGGGVGGAEPGGNAALAADADQRGPVPGAAGSAAAAAGPSTSPATLPPAPARHSTQEDDGGGLRGQVLRRTQGAVLDGLPGRRRHSLAGCVSGGFAPSSPGSGTVSSGHQGGHGDGEAPSSPSYSFSSQRGRDPQHLGGEHGDRSLNAGQPQPHQQQMPKQSPQEQQGTRPPTRPRTASSCSQPATPRAARVGSRPNGNSGGGGGSGSGGGSAAPSAVGMTLHLPSAGFGGTRPRTNPVGAGVWGLGGCTAADLERLRAAEIRKRRQADEQARRLATELAAHMEALAGVHYRREVVKWHGLMPWLRLVAMARRAGERADRHFAGRLMRRALMGLARGATRARMRAVGRVAAAVATGRLRFRERVTRTALSRWRAWIRAAALHRRHLVQRALLGLIQAARMGWSARAEAAEYWWRRRLWGCFHGWRGAAERQASERLLWELQRLHEAEAALGRRLARRVLAEWRRQVEEAAAQRAALQHRSQQWAKVQGWLKEVQVARTREGRARGVGVSSAAASARGSYGGQDQDAGGRPEVVAGGAGGGAAADLACSSSSTIAGLRGVGESAAQDDGGGEGSSTAGRFSGVLAVSSLRKGSCAGISDDDNDPLGLGPLDEQLQQFSLAPSGRGLQAPCRKVCGSDDDPWVSGGALPSRHGGSVLAYGWQAAVPAELAGPTATRWATRREGGSTGAVAGHRPVGPPALASRRDRLARYLEGRSTGGARPEGD